MKTTLPDIYYCSKPLQYFNIKNIPQIDGESKYKILVFLKAFIGADDFIDKIMLHDDYWNEVIKVDKLCELRKYQSSHPANYVFVENDASLFIAYVKIVNKINRLFVFEEGIGSYSERKHNFINKLLRKVLGVGTHYGDARYSKNIILYNPHFYNKKWGTNKAMSFKKSFKECVESNYDLFVRLSGGFPKSLMISDKSILIYITDHCVNNEILEKMREEKKSFDLLFIKPHPHIKSIELDIDDVTIIETNLMMEFLIHKLLVNRNKVTIWHEASTSVVYYMNSINTLNFGHFPIFDEFVNAIECK